MKKWIALLLGIIMTFVLSGYTNITEDSNKIGWLESIRNEYIKENYDNLEFDIIEPKTNQKMHFNAEEVYRNTVKFSDIFNNGSSSIFFKFLHNSNSEDSIDKYIFETSINNCINELNNSATRIDSENANIMYNSTTEKYEIQKDTIGTVLNKSNLYNNLIVHLKYGKGNYILSTQDYILADIIESDSKVVNLCTELNNLIGSYNGTLYVGNIEIKFNKNDLIKYITPTIQDGSYEFDRNSCAIDFVDNVINKLNIHGETLKIETTDGLYVDVPFETYKFDILRDASINNIKAYLESGEKTFFKLEYDIQSGYGDPGDMQNYILISISNQRLFAYKNRELIIESDIVTGNPNKNNDTPKGVYNMNNKSRNIYLTGPTWRSFVSYWMPFVANKIGMHDMTSRDKFGGEIYKYNGSRGCVNMPLDKAGQLYKEIDTTYKVIVY